MSDIEPTRQDGPPAVLMLGERSPYGVSVAAALLKSRFRVTAVILPSMDAYRRSKACAAATRHARTSLEDGDTAPRTRRSKDDEAPRVPAGAGEAIRPLALDPGTTPAALEKLCAGRGIEWLRVDGVNTDNFRGWIAQYRPDLLLSAAFPLILGEKLLAAPSIGAVNFHPSLLPRCRGCHPLFWTLASGETMGGVTAHYMTREIDAGDIVAQIPLPLTAQDDYASLYRRAMETSPALVSMVEEFFVSGQRDGKPQDHSRATYFHEDTEQDHRIRWDRRSAGEIIALTRTGEAFTTLRGERLGVLKAAEARPFSREKRLSLPGRVADVHEENLLVSVPAGAVAISRVAFRGRRHVAGELARILGVGRGEVLG